MVEISIKKLKKIDFEFEENIAIVGMPGIANVGKNVVLTAVDSLSADKVVEVLFDDFPAQVTTDVEGILTLPSAKVFAKILEDKNKVFFFLTGDFQPVSPQGIYEFSVKIADLLKELKVKLVISTGAYVSNFITDQPKIYVSSTSDALNKNFLKFKGVKLMEDGTISGANGLIPIISNKRYDIDGVCLLAETNPMSIVEPSASKAIVNLLNQFFGISINVEKLDEQIKKMEQLLSKIKDEYSKKKNDKQQPYIS